MRQFIVIPFVAAFGCVGQGEHVGSHTAALIDPATCEPDHGRVYVGVAVGASCPAVPVGAPWTLYTFAGRTADGRRICRYTFTGPGYATLAEVGTLPSAIALDMECPATVPLSDPLAHVFSSYSLSYNRQMERASSLPYVTKTLPATVRVGILGSSVDSGPSDVEPMFGNNAHERAVGMAIRQMTCPRGRAHASSACIPEFKNYLALTLSGGELAVGGGDYGYMSTLAMKLDQMVNRWIADGRPHDLIANMSLGFHPAYVEDGSYVSAVPTAITVGHPAGQAVRAAIQRARCEGALIIAAVGNASNNPSEVSNVGPVLPAAWAAERTRCLVGSIMEERPYPLLYAAGGVDGADAPLLLRRDNADTELVAPAFEVMPDNAPANPDPTVYLPPMTGSSFGAAGLTAAASIVWGYRPTLSPDQVIDVVYENAQGLGLPPADVCEGVCQPTRRISICRTVVDAALDACSGAGVLCPRLPTCSIIGAGAGTNPSVATPPPGATIVEDPGWEIVPDGAMCASTQVYADPAAEPSEAWCPAEHFDGFSDHPFTVEGQPEPKGCPACMVFWQNANPVIFYMQINPQWSPASPITGAVLELGNQSFDLDYAAPNGTFSPGFQSQFQLPVMPKPAWAKITFTVAQNVNGQPGTYTFSEQVNLIAQ